MALDHRTEMYRKINYEGNEELDYLTSNFNNMNLTTIANETVTSMTVNRVDLISFKHYRNYHYGWLILEHNGIIDPVEEIFIGRTLKIPSLEDYFRFKNRNKRGIS
jgi:hypothetical protein